MEPSLAKIRLLRRDRRVVRIFPQTLVAALMSSALLAGCATPPASTAPAQPNSASITTTTASPTALQCPAPVCPACALCAPADEPLIDLRTDPAAPGTELPRGHLEKTNWDLLPDFSADDPTEALRAFVLSCKVLGERPEWKSVCLQATSLNGASSAQRKETINAFFREQFMPYRVVQADGSETGLVTGYYEPLLRGSRSKTKVYKYPLYSTPQDLISIELADVYPDLKYRRLRGRMVGNKLVPYLERSEIESKVEPLKGLELAWVDNAVDLFFLQIQGSGQIAFEDGTRLRVGYADQNGHPFRSVAGALIRRGELRAERASMQGIKAWAAAHPRRAQQFLNMNPSYVFFKPLPADLSGPIGTLGVPLTAERSIAVDQRVIPLGVPVYLSTSFPNSKQGLNRLVVAQDTGGAIAGGVRADYYWGFGDEAGSMAGRMKQPGRMWVLLPKDYTLSTTTPAVKRTSP